MIIHNTNNDTIMVTETIKFYNKLSKVTVYGELEQP